MSQSKEVKQNWKDRNTLTPLSSQYLVAMSGSLISGKETGRSPKILVLSRMTTREATR